MRFFFHLFTLFLPLFLPGLESQKLSSHKFYGQPIFVFGENVSFFGGGIGYRFHRVTHGCDISLNAIPNRICSSQGYWPFLKASYLFYPQSKGLYLGMGANLGFFTGFLITVGYELTSQKFLLTFIQLDMTYPSTIGNASLGIGF